MCPLIYSDENSSSYKTVFMYKTQSINNTDIGSDDGSSVFRVMNSYFSTPEWRKRAGVLNFQVQRPTPVTYMYTAVVGVTERATSP